MGAKLHIILQRQFNVNDRARVAPAQRPSDYSNKLFNMKVVIN